MKIAVLKNKENSHLFSIQKENKFYACSSIPTLTDAFHLTLAEFRQYVKSNTGREINGELVAPIAPEIEVGGAGVTYLRSRDARKEEIGVPDVYQRVYEADCPELFYKGNTRRTRETNTPISIRYDSAASVLEPEVAIFINKFKEIIGYSICNDVTARSLEGENPLYPSQAKMYVGSAALGLYMLPSWLIYVPAETTIAAKIIRDGKSIWDASTSLASLNRSLSDLVDYLFRCQEFPDGVILSTGTGIVPPLEIALAQWDVVEITVAGIGTLSNSVITIPESP
ncbi:MAG: fumarylacetoacetate hydrolase [Actinomycetales bacterium]|nr:MAG: fumarylacetoacetate hydrolase [Actinomycetales bacterium]